MYKYIEPEHILNSISKDFEKISGDLEPFISKANPNDIIDTSEESLSSKAFSQVARKLTQNVDHCGQYMKSAKENPELSVYITRNIEQIAGTLKQAKMLLAKTDKYLQKHADNKETYSKVASAYRNYVETFDWTKLRHFNYRNDYKTNPDFDIEGNAYDFIDPEKREETITALQSALTIDPPS